MPVANARRKYSRCTWSNTAGLHPAQIRLQNNPAATLAQWRENLPAR